MTIERTIYDTSTLLGVLRNDEEMQPPASYWRDLCFPNQVNFTDEFIDFGRLSDHRKIAPLVVPTAQGKPIYSAAEARERIKPAYVKPKDPVTASTMMRRRPGLNELEPNNALTPQARYNLIVGEILRQHRFAIERRWEWLAAKAIIDGQVVLEDEAYPRTIVDFGRSPDHDVVLGAGNRWGDAGVSIIDNLGRWRTIARRTPFGGPVGRMTIGGEVWEVMRKDPEINDRMDTQIRRAGETTLNLGIREAAGTDIEIVGRLDGVLDVVIYSDYYDDGAGNIVDMMDPREMVLTGNNVDGVQCFGAIQDINAQFQALSIFPKMWPEQDPSATYIMSQSAPLMVPRRINNTFRARPIG